MSVTPSQARINRAAFASAAALSAMACTKPGEPAPPEYWQAKVCVQPRYQALDQCTQGDKP
jgi:hypothetical protein